jgi:hypothetical protein
VVGSQAVGVRKTWPDALCRIQFVQGGLFVRRISIRFQRNEFRCYGVSDYADSTVPRRFALRLATIFPKTTGSLSENPDMTLDCASPNPVLGQAEGQSIVASRKGPNRENLETLSCHARR